MLLQLTKQSMAAQHSGQSGFFCPLPAVGLCAAQQLSMQTLPCMAIAQMAGQWRQRQAQRRRLSPPQVPALMAPTAAAQVPSRMPPRFAERASLAGP